VTVDAEQSRNPRPSRTRRVLLVAAALVVTGGVAVRGCADGLFYWPDDATHVHGEDANGEVGARDVWFASSDGTRLHGWWLEASATRVGTVVYCHGNHANLTHHVRFVRWLPAHGFDVLIFDYRGYGQSEGTPSREGTVDDAVAAIDLALARDPHGTVLFGHSLGGAIGTVAAGRRPAVRAIAVEATFATYRAAARAQAPLFAFAVPWLVSSGLDPIDSMDRLPPRPVLVIHSDDDAIVPFELGRELFERAREPRAFHHARGAGHATPWLREGRAFEAMLVDFFRSAIR
jgi:fermentation-respiration switch protein FrsA (DUF1100 family)